MKNEKNFSMIDFTYGSLEKWIKYVKNKGYVFSDFYSWDGYSKVILLRCDEDLDIEFSYRMSKLFKRLKVPATFFIRTDAEFYNPYSQENKGKLKEMSEEGFEIGLHFDASKHKVFNEKRLRKGVEFETKMLSKITEKKVKSISLHSPSTNGKYPLIKNYLNAYNPKIFSPEKYLSDSKMFWSKNPYDFIKRVEKHPIQILIHPMHYRQDKGNYKDIFCDFLNLFIDKVQKGFNMNKTYVKDINGRNLKEIFKETK